MQLVVFENMKVSLDQYESLLKLPSNILCRPALSNAAPAIYFSGALRKHIILSQLLIIIQILRQKTFLNVWVLLNIFTISLKHGTVLDIP
jgi:hypothetical protein